MKIDLKKQAKDAVIAFTYAALPVAVVIIGTLAIPVDIELVR